MRVPVFFSLIGILLAAAAPAGPGSPAPTVIDVTIERIGPDDWTATLSTSGPVTALAFTRSGDNNRIGPLQVLTDGVTLDRFGDVDALVASHPVSEIRIHMAPSTIARGDDYTPFVPIAGAAASDTSAPATAMAVYSHYFQLAPTDIPALQGGIDADALIAPAHRFNFIDHAGGDVIFAGNPMPADDRVTLDDGLGAYAVFGAPPRLAGSNFNSLVSPEIPERIATQILSTVPQALTALEIALEAELAQPPSLILTRRPSDSSGIHFRGGAMTSDIVMELAGGALDDPDFVRNNRSLITTLVVHELAHLWNGGLVQNTDPNAAWIHEGSAEALSWEALTTVFSMDEAYSMNNYQSALDECTVFLAAGGLAGAVERGQRRAHYACGATIMLALSTALSPTDRPAGLHALWAAMIDNSQSLRDGQYDSDLFLQTYAELGGTGIVTTWIRHMEAGEFQDPAAFLVDGLNAAGVATDLVDGAPVLSR